MRVKDVSIRTGLSGRTIRRWIADGKLEVAKDESGQYFFTDEHVETILRAKQPDYRPIDRYVLSLSNHKGGVGKTATAVNLARELSTRYKVLLIDLDPQANATETTVDNPDDRSFMNHISDGVPLRDLILEARYFHVLPSHVSFSLLEMNIASLDETVLSLRRALEDVDDYEFILIDTPPTLGIFQYMALCASDGVLIPVQAASFAINGIYNLTGLINKVNEQYDVSAALLGIALTLYDQRNTMDKSVRDQLSTEFVDQVFNTVIRRNTSVNEAMTLRLAVRDLAPKSYGAQDYRELAEETIYHVTQS